MEKQKILVTGGTGYIGSHTVVKLIEAGYEVVILDNLFNSQESVLDSIKKITGVRPRFHRADIRRDSDLNRVFQQHKFDAVLHFAGLKAVPESVAKPWLYYENNVGGAINLLQAMAKHEVKKIVFSSTACVYGEQVSVVYHEKMPCGSKIANPYGRTKYMVEEILRDSAAADDELQVSILRYFNPIGNHESGILGEDPNGIPNNLMPIIMKVATGEMKQLSIFGNDYETIDGTCVRDFCHVTDLAEGHIAALEHLKPGVATFNLGTGKGTSVMQMVDAFQDAADRKLPHQFADRRPGDLPEYYADPSKANKELKWQTKLDYRDAMRDTLAYLKHTGNYE